MELVERFLDYVSYDTQSSEESTTTPSTSKQMVFARHLAQQLSEIGLSDVDIDDNGYIMASLPANTDKTVPTVGFISHFDTSPDCSGADIHPRIVKNYDGGDIVLSEGIVTSPEMFPELKDHVGEDIIVTDGHTLLGADDKAGIAEIVQAMVYLMEQPEIKHGLIRVGFNPDEEIGLGAHKFDVEKFGCDFAYTMDGGERGEIEFENFNAASAKVTITGRSVHPGYAKGKMINASKVAAEFAMSLPANETPETTEGYQGFYHLIGMSGNVEKATLNYIIRDHSRECFEMRKLFIAGIANNLAEKYGKDVVKIEIKDQYYNMREKVEPMMYIISIAKEAILQTGTTPVVRAIRGGTDGAQLSFKGLPCPNIFAGGLNFHGPHEFCPIPNMEAAMQTVVNICKLVEEKLG